MYDPVRDPFFPCRSDKQRIRMPMKDILMGERLANPYHPDPALNAFLRYIPSMFLQALDIELDEEQWDDLTENGIESEYISDYREQVETRLAEIGDFFTLYPDQSGFYQHHHVKDPQKLKQDLDFFLIHGTSGHNPVHHRVNASLKQVCVSCALLALMHHNNFCPAGTVGHSNFRGQTCYLCMLHDPDPFKRMLLNTFFPSVDDEELRRYGWESPQGEADQPSWRIPGKPVKNGFEDQEKDVGLKRAVLYTPRHVFFDMQTEKGRCDLCGLESEIRVRQYYWERYGDKLNSNGVVIRHPTQAIYKDEKKKDSPFLPVNFNPSIWRNLGSLVVKDFISNNTRYDPAPLVMQFQNTKAEDAPFFTLELMAYEASQAKLLNFHHDILTLPCLSQSQDWEGFYMEIQKFTAALTEMLTAFRYYGTEGKKRERAPLQTIGDRHAQLTDRFGQETLNQLMAFRQAYKERTLHRIFGAQLSEYARSLRNEFERLCQTEYPWDDVAAQVKLNRQKRFLAGALKKIAQRFEA